MSNSAPHFSPGHSTVVGTRTVVWHNGPLSDPHAVQVFGIGIASPDIPPGSEWATVIDREGTFPFQCRYHPWMKGTITVVSETLRVKEWPLPAGFGPVARLALGRAGTLAVIEGGEATGTDRVSGRILLIDESGHEKALTRRTGRELHYLAAGSGVLYLRTSIGLARVDLATGARRDFPGAGTRGKAAVAVDGALWLAESTGNTIRLTRRDAVGRAKAWVVRAAGPVLELGIEQGDIAWLLLAPGQRAVRVDSRNATYSIRPLGEASRVSQLVTTHGSVWCADPATNRICRLGDEATAFFAVPPDGGPVDLLTATPNSEVMWYVTRENGRVLASDARRAPRAYALPPAYVHLAQVQPSETGDLWLLAQGGQRLGRARAPFGRQRPDDHLHLGGSAP